MRVLDIGTLHAVTRWFIYAISLIVTFFVAGWALVLLSGSSPRTGGSRLLWQIGGLMVYASVICVPICLIAGVVALMVELVVHGPEPADRRVD